jgi:hypothetical protein
MRLGLFSSVPVLLGEVALSLGVPVWDEERLLAYLAEHE